MVKFKIPTQLIYKRLLLFISVYTGYKRKVFLSYFDESMWRTKPLSIFRNLEVDGPAGLSQVCILAHPGDKIPGGAMSPNSPVTLLS